MSFVFKYWGNANLSVYWAETLKRTPTQIFDRGCERKSSSSTNRIWSIYSQSFPDSIPNLRKHCTYFLFLRQHFYSGLFFGCHLNDRQEQWRLPCLRMYALLLGVWHKCTTSRAFPWKFNLFGNNSWLRKIPTLKTSNYALKCVTAT